MGTEDSFGWCLKVSSVSIRRWLPISCGARWHCSDRLLSRVEPGHASFSQYRLTRKLSLARTKRPRRPPASSNAGPSVESVIATVRAVWQAVETSSDVNQAELKKSISDTVNRLKSRIDATLGNGSVVVHPPVRLLFDGPFEETTTPYGPKTDPQCCGCLARSICHLGERHCGVALQVVARRVIFQTPLAEDLCGIRSRNSVCILQQSFIALKGQLDRHWDLT
jgi:hypothetical protein